MTKRRAPRRGASYSCAIQWIADNDDTGWLNDPADELIPSVTATLVADLFGRTTDQVTADLRRAVRPCARRVA